METDKEIVSHDITQMIKIRKSRFPFTEPSGGFEQRIVKYEDIHGIKEADFNELVRLTDPQMNDIILDAGSGYGAVSREIINRVKNLNLTFLLYDFHEIQLKRGLDDFKAWLPKEQFYNQLEFVHGDVRKIDLQDNSVDKVVAKMVIHEIPYHEQSLVFKEFFRVLKPGGKLIIWDTNLNSGTQSFFQNVIRKKDELANYNHLFLTRYFLREDEMQRLAVINGFQCFNKEYIINYNFNSEKRLMPEFKGDFKKLSDWNTYIREQVNLLPRTVYNEIYFSDNDSTIKFRVEKAIYTCYK